MSFNPPTGRILEGYQKNTGRCHDSRQVTLGGNSWYAHGKTIHGPFAARPPWRALGDPENSANWPGVWRCSKPAAHRKGLFTARRFEGPGPIWGSVSGALSAALTPGMEPRQAVKFNFYPHTRRVPEQYRKSATIHGKDSRKLTTWECHFTCIPEEYRKL